MAAENPTVPCLTAKPAYENVLTSRCTDISTHSDFPAPGADPRTECKAHYSKAKLLISHAFVFVSTCVEK